MKNITYILFSLVMLQGTFSAAANNTLINAKMDSTLLLMGKKTAIHVEVVQDKGQKGFFVNEGVDTLNAFVEVSERLQADTTDLGNDRIQINRDIIVQSFDSGMYVIPAFKYVIGKDTFKSNELTLKVLPVKVDSLPNIHDLKPVAEPPFFFSDYLPEFLVKYWWLIILVLVLIAAGIYAYFKWFKKGELPLRKKEKVIPPYDEAIMKLTQLKSEHLWEAGQEKEYFTRLTDILRNYIDRRFEINAMEMTSSQIIDVLRKNEETMPVNEQLSKILEMADFVKFAKMRPLPEDNEVAYQRALNFVNETKPVEVVPEEESAEGKTGGKEEVVK
ncbi:MAG: cell wall anchor protein [Muribaculaceae bacterium]|nr:cell wall anchor protein [Muribaculaceae bacterium]